MECGSRFALACASCGTELPDRARFCLNCGTPVTGSGSAAAESAPAASQPVESQPAESQPAVTAPAAPAGQSLPPEPTAGGAPLPESFVGGRYRTVRFLGKGGRKHVYLARDTTLDRDVAVAVIPTDGLDQDGAERVRREARAMARLGDHPNIVAVYDAVEEPGAHLIVSQFMPGGDLSTLIKDGDGGRLGIEQALVVARQLCAALTHAHTHGVFHRDLKPANVFLGADGAIRLGDFGLARLADNKDLTLSGSFLGTAAYMPPEQALGGQVDARSDLYALGCLIYDMVSGRPPFTGDDTVGVIGQQINAAPVPPSWHNPSVPRSLDRLVLELLAKAPSDRPPTAGIVAERLGAVDLDEVADPHDAARRSNTGNLVLGRMVGRHQELAALRERIDQAAGGQGSLTLLVGEPGIGKTRLAQESATFAELRDVTVLWGRCYESEAALPYRPWTEIINQYARTRRDDELRLELGSGLDDVARLVSEVGDRFGARQADASRVEAEADRLRLFDSVVTFLQQAARTRPVLVIIDDLHWADTPSLLLMQHLARRLPESRICVIGTYRDVDLDRQHPLAGVVAELRQRRLYERIRLHGFDIDELRAMLAMAGQQDESTISEAFVGALLEETEGNPFFVEETLRHLVESGKLYRRGAQWVSDATSVSDLDIPEGVREVIGRRLSRLSERCNSALHYAAVLGREFEFNVLRVMTELSEDDLLSAVEEALDASIIREFKERPGVAAYQFTHALVQQTLLDELSLPRLQRLHFRAGEAIEAAAGRGVPRQAAVLAGHYRAAGAGGDLDKALRYTVEAEEAAEAIYAWEESAALFRSAVELMDELRRPEQEVGGYLLAVMNRVMTTAVIPQDELIVLGARARSAFADDPAHRSQYELATVFFGGFFQNSYEPAYLDLARAEALLDEVEPSDPGVQTWRRLIRLNVEAAIPRPAPLLALAESIAADDTIGPWAAVYRGLALGLQGAMLESREVIGNAWEASLRSTDQRAVLAAHIAVTCDMYFTVETKSPGLSSGFVERELALRRQSVPRALDIRLGLLMVARERGETLPASAVPPFADLPDGLTDQARNYWWMIAARDGRWAEALANYEDSYRLFARGGAHSVAALSATLAADLLVVRGELAQAESLLAEVLAHATPLRDATTRSRLAYLAALDGRATDALEQVEWCRSHLADDDWGGLPGVVDLAEALVRLASGDHGTALARFESAVEVTRRVQCPWDEAETHLRWGQALARHRDASEALPHFDAALAIYRRVKAGQPWLDRVVAARLEALGHSSDADASSSVLVLSRSIRAERPALGASGAAEVTLVFSDIEGSTALNQRLGDAAWLAVLHAHNEVVEGRARAHGGTIVKSMGDGYMITFATPAAALRCASAIQAHLTAAAPPLEGIKVRMGVHAGAAMSEGGDFFGLQVALAARVANAAVGGETLVSQPVWEHVVGAGEFGFGPGRSMTFKGIADPQVVYALER